MKSHRRQFLLEIGSLERRRGFDSGARFPRFSRKSHRRDFLKQLGFGAVGFGFIASLPDCFGAPLAAHGRLPRSTPEEQGVSSQGILEFLDALGRSKHEFHSFVMVRHGHAIAEGWWAPYRAELPHMLYSLSKSFTSTGVGFAVSERRMTVEDPVTTFFPQQLPEHISENLAALRVKHLLTMSVGHAEDSTGKLWGEQDWVKKFLSLPIANRPGGAFLYNSGATYMLSAIVQKVTGQKLLDYLRPRLFEPLAINEASWEVCPRGINTGGWGLKLQTGSLAKFGQMYLQKGVWNGKQLLPPAWIEEASSFKIQQPGADLERLKRESDWHQGYCYQFWRCRHNAFRGDGAFGQFTVVMPQQDVVLSITSESPSMQGELDLVWEHLLPAMTPTALPANKGAHRELTERLAHLELEPLRGQATSPTTERISGKSFHVATNEGCVESVSWDFRHHACTFTLKDNKGQYPIACGLGKWVYGLTSMPGTPPKLTSGDLGPNSKVAASGAWKDDNTFEMIWRFVETPHHDTVTCRFDGDKVKIEYLNSLAAMSAARKDKRPSLEGVQKS